MTPRDLDASLTGGASADAGSTLEGVIEYYERVRDDPEFETTVVPVGEGLFASVRTSQLPVTAIEGKR